jgi:hypothetical protein
MAKTQSRHGQGVGRYDEEDSDVRWSGRPMARGGAAGLCVRVWRVAPARDHPRKAQEPERNTWTKGHQPASTCVRMAAESARRAATASRAGA